MGRFIVGLLMGAVLGVIVTLILLSALILFLTNISTELDRDPTKEEWKNGHRRK